MVGTQEPGKVGARKARSDARHSKGRYSVNGDREDAKPGKREKGGTRCGKESKQDTNQHIKHRANLMVPTSMSMLKHMATNNSEEVFHTAATAAVLDPS